MMAGMASVSERDDQRDRDAQGAREASGANADADVAHGMGLIELSNVIDARLTQVCDVWDIPSITSELGGGLRSPHQQQGNDPDLGQSLFVEHPGGTGFDPSSAVNDEQQRVEETDPSISGSGARRPKGSTHGLEPARRDGDFPGMVATAHGGLSVSADTSRSCAANDFGYAEDSTSGTPAFPRGQTGGSACSPAAAPLAVQTNLWNDRTCTDTHLDNRRPTPPMSPGTLASVVRYGLDNIDDDDHESVIDLVRKKTHIRLARQNSLSSGDSSGVHSSVSSAQSTPKAPPSSMNVMSNAAGAGGRMSGGQGPRKVRSSKHGDMRKSALVMGGGGCTGALHEKKPHRSRRSMAGSLPPSQLRRNESM